MKNDFSLSLFLFLSIRWQADILAPHKIVFGGGQELVFLQVVIIDRLYYFLSIRSLVRVPRYDSTVSLLATRLGVKTSRPGALRNTFSTIAPTYSLPMGYDKIRHRLFFRPILEYNTFSYDILGRTTSEPQSPATGTSAWPPGPTVSPQGP